jgi:hypothetical protein
VQLRFVTLHYVTVTLCDFTLCANIPEAGGVSHNCSFTGSQKREEERVEDSMYLIPEAGVVYIH